MPTCYKLECCLGATKVLDQGISCKLWFVQTDSDRCPITSVFILGVTCVFFSWVGCVFLFWVTCVLSLLSKQQARTKTLLGQPWAFGLGLLFLGLRPGSTPVFFHSGFGVGLPPFTASAWLYSF